MKSEKIEIKVEKEVMKDRQTDLFWIKASFLKERRMEKLISLLESFDGKLSQVIDHTWVREWWRIEFC
jgi:hypothetical protein